MFYYTQCTVNHLQTETSVDTNTER